LATHVLWEHEIVGSSPTTPTTDGERECLERGSAERPERVPSIGCSGTTRVHLDEPYASGGKRGSEVVGTFADVLCDYPTEARVSHPCHRSDPQRGCGPSCKRGVRDPCQGRSGEARLDGPRRRAPRAADGEGDGAPLLRHGARHPAPKAIHVALSKTWWGGVVETMKPTRRASRQSSGGKRSAEMTGSRAGGWFDTLRRSGVCWRHPVAAARWPDRSGVGGRT
jgi:hypothetical protein